jgi:hypothetical protein
VFESEWRPGRAGHVIVSVPVGEAAHVEHVWGIGQRVNLFADERPTGWVRVTDLARVGEREGEVKYRLAFESCDPPAPPNEQAPRRA